MSHPLSSAVSAVTNARERNTGVRFPIARQAWHGHPDSPREKPRPISIAARLVLHCEAGLPKGRGFAKSPIGT